MRLEYLHYLLVIDAHHSISAAARELYISQTALSSIVSRVEEELGFPIFLRSREGVTPTEEGKEALAIAWDIWSGWTASLSIGQQKEGAPVAVHIIGSPSVNNSLALPLIRSYYQVEQRGNLIFHEVIGSDVGPSILNKRRISALRITTKKS